MDNAKIAGGPASADNPSTAGVAKGGITSDYAQYVKMLEAHAMSLLDSATVYAFAYMQDEADDVGDCVCGEEQHERAKAVFAAIKSLDKVLAAPAPHAQPEPAEQVPTDISQRLRTSLANCGPGALLQPLRADIMAAAEEIERYYGVMLAWKKTAEKKDRDWQAERMGRVDDRIAARGAAEFAAAQVPTAAEVRDQALKFADDVISNAFDGGDLDGATIQEMAEARGLIKPQTMAEPCGAVCGCMESGADFPAACYRKTYAAVLRTTSKAQASAHSESGGDDA